MYKCETVIQSLSTPSSSQVASILHERYEKIMDLKIVVLLGIALILISRVEANPIYESDELDVQNIALEDFPVHRYHVHVVACHCFYAPLTR